jgi:hypothetical protein
MTALVLDDLSRRLGNVPRKSISRAGELMRLIDVKTGGCPVAPVSIVPSVCLELALRQHGQQCDRNVLVKASACTDKAYAAAFRSISNLLGINVSPTVPELGVMFGGSRVVPSVGRCIEDYRSRMATLGMGAVQPNVLNAAAFFMVSKKHNIKFEKERLVKLMDIDDAMFNRVCNSMVEVVFDHVGTASQKTKEGAVNSISRNRELVDALLERKRPAEDSQQRASSGRGAKDKDKGDKDDGDDGDDEDDEDDEDEDDKDDADVLKVLLPGNAFATGSSATGAMRVEGIRPLKKQKTASLQEQKVMDYDAWKKSVLEAKDAPPPQSEPPKATKQTTLSFAPSTKKE